MYSHGESPNQVNYRDSEYFGQIKNFGQHFRTINKSKDLWKEPRMSLNKSLEPRREKYAINRFPLLKSNQNKRYDLLREKKMMRSSLDESTRPRILVPRERPIDKIRLKRAPIVSSKHFKRGLGFKKSKVRSRLFETPKHKISENSLKRLKKEGKVK